MKALPAAGLSTPCLLRSTCATLIEQYLFLSCFQLSCLDVIKGKNWAEVFLKLEIMHVVKRQFFFIAQVESAYRQLGKKTSLCEKTGNLPWISLRENKHRAS